MYRDRASPELLSFTKDYVTSVRAPFGKTTCHPPPPSQEIQIPLLQPSEKPPNVQIQ